MKKILLSVMIMQLLGFAGVVFAECVQPAQVIGKWQVWDVDGLFADESQINDTMAALDSGKATVEELIENTKDARLNLSGAAEFFESGELVLKVVAASPDSPITMAMTMQAAWKSDCDKIILQATALEEIKVAVNPDAKLSAEKKADIEKQIAGIEAQMKAEAANKDSEFNQPSVEKLLYVSANYLLTKEEGKAASDSAVTIYKK